MHVIKWTDHFSDKFLGDLQVDAGARNVGVAHELLYNSKVDTLFEQMSGERMTEAITVCIIADLRLHLETAKGHGTTTPATPLDVASASSASSFTLLSLLQAYLPASGTNYIKIGQGFSNNNAADLSFNDVNYLSTCSKNGVAPTQALQWIFAGKHPVFIRKLES